MSLMGLPSRTIVDEAADLIEHGLHVLLLRGKLPASEHGYLDATIDIDRIAELVAASPDATNLGIAPGRSGLIVVDLDETKPVGKVPALIRLQELAIANGGMPATLTVRTGSGGRHLYFLAHPDRVLGQGNGIRNPITGRTESGVDYRGVKGYVVVPPSVHPTSGKDYRWETRSGSFDLSKVLPIPEWLIEFLDPPKVQLEASGWDPPEIPATQRDQRRVAGMVDHACQEIGKLGEGMSRRTELQRAAYRLAGLCWTGYPVESLRGSLQSAAHACGHWDEDTRRTIDDAIMDGLAKPYPLPPDSPEFAAKADWRATKAEALRNWARGHREDDEDDDGAIRTEDEQLGAEPEDQVMLLLDIVTPKSGRPHPRPTLRNLITVLEEDSRWAGKVEDNVFSDTLLLAGHAATDASEIDLACWVDLVYRLDVSPMQVHQALVAIAARNERHPIQDYLDSLIWDGEPRLCRWLVNWAGVDETPDPLTDIFGTRWMISAVARVYEPGCQADSALVLTGGKGLGKTSTLRILASLQWHSESPLAIGTDEAPKKLAGVWIYEIGEFASAQRAQIEAVKGFVTTRIDRFRPSYGRNQVVRPRRCVFAATTNDLAFLVEEDRRWWVRRVVRRADLAGLEEVRDQLWAEAVHRYRAGETWHLDADMSVKQSDDVDQYRQVDAWEDAIRQYILGRSAVTTAEVLVQCLKRELKDVTKSDEMRVSRCLTSLGRRRVRRWDGKVRVYEWTT